MEKILCIARLKITLPSELVGEFLERNNRFTPTGKLECVLDHIWDFVRRILDLQW
jgi:hypothetical protein